jgi:hypothetical protein
MIKNIHRIILFVVYIPCLLMAQEPDKSMIYFGSSKSQFLGVGNSVTYWMGEFAKAENRSLAVDGQYGHNCIHRVLPPDSATLGQHELKPWLAYPEGSPERQWKTSFAVTQYDNAIISKASFFPTWLNADSSSKGVIRVVDFIRNIDSGGVADLPVYIYMLWPHLGTLKMEENPDSITQEELKTFHRLSAGAESHPYYQHKTNMWPAWWEELQDTINAKVLGPKVRLIPASLIIGKMFVELDFLHDITPKETFMDSYGHGTASFYFLYGMLHYMAIYEQTIPEMYAPSEMVIPQIRDNYHAIRNFAWNELVAYNDTTGRVFSKVAEDEKTTGKFNIEAKDGMPIKIATTANQFTISAPLHSRLVLYDVKGKVIAAKISSGEAVEFSAKELSSGVYFISVKSGASTKSYRLVR